MTTGEEYIQPLHFWHGFLKHTRQLLETMGGAAAGTLVVCVLAAVGVAQGFGHAANNMSNTIGATGKALAVQEQWCG